MARIITRLGAIGVAIGLGPLALPAAIGATLAVENNGADSSGCGTVSSPCRSISRAILNAAAGDTIVVGPGSYGDLNGNQTLREHDEESGGLGVVVIDRPLTVISREGASRTIINAGGAMIHGVVITADRVVFGTSSHGFFVTGAGYDGVTASGRTALRIGGNVASGNAGSGFAVGGTGHSLKTNLAIGNRYGFSLYGRQHIVEANRALINREQGFRLSGTGHAVRTNLAGGNGSAGFELMKGGQQLRQNSAIGNKGAGILLNAGSSAGISGGNLYGNGDASTLGIANCGVHNRSSGRVTATNAYWGSAKGPGGNPADAACNETGASTVTSPFSTTAFALQSGF